MCECAWICSRRDGDAAWASQSDGAPRSSERGVFHLTTDSAAASSVEAP